jgi:hypothetical protein
MMEDIRQEEIQCLARVLWYLGMRNRGQGEYYYGINYTLCCDRWEDNLVVTRNLDGKKIIGYNPERSVINWYGEDNDFRGLWNVINNHDEKRGVDWFVG